MSRLATFAAVLALALAVAVLVQPLGSLRVLTGMEPSAFAAAGDERGAWLLVAVLRVCAALLVALGAMLIALRREVAASAAVRQTIGLGLAACAVVVLTQAYAVFTTPAAWVLGALAAIIGVVFVASARTAGGAA